MNSSPCKFLVFAYIISTSTSTHVLSNINIPTFLDQDQNHLKLAELSRQRHCAAINGESQIVLELETQIDILASKLWKLTAKELKAIQDALINSQRAKSSKTKIVDED